MRKFVLAVGLALTASALFLQCVAPQDTTVSSASKTKIEVHFSPKGGCTDAIVAHIHAAKISIHVQAYSFTSAPIAVALAVAKTSGVDVQVIVDSSDIGDSASPTTKVNTLLAASIPVFDDSKHAIAHNKVMIFDGVTVEMGSFNYTAQAENANAENCNFVSDKTVAAEYESNWQLHKTHSPAVQ